MRSLGKGKGQGDKETETGRQRCIFVLVTLSQTINILASGNGVEYFASTNYGHASGVFERHNKRERKGDFSRIGAAAAEAKGQSRGPKLGKIPTRTLNFQDLLPST